MKNKKRWICFILTLVMLFGMAPLPAHAETLPPGSGDDADWGRIQEIIGTFSEKNVWTNTAYSGAITNKMPHTAILGNGNVGVTSYGNATEKTYLLSTTDFWSDSAKSFGYSGRSPQIITGGGLTIAPVDRGYGNNGTAAAATFREEMDIAKAEIRTAMNLGSAPVDIVNWLSADKNIMVTKITSKSDAEQSLAISAWGKDGVDVLPTDSGVIEENGRKMVWSTRKSNTDGASWMSEFAVASTVLGGEKTEYSAAGNKGTILVDVPAGETVTVVTAVKCEGNQKDINAPDGADGLAVQGARELLSGVADTAAVEALHQSHLDWWRDYYLLSWMDLGDADLNRTYYGSQYIFGCATREQSVASGIYGVWITTDNAGWQGDYHLNYNFQGPFYASYSSNRLKEFSQPMFDVFLNFIDVGIERAANPEHLKAVTAGSGQSWYYDTRQEEDAFKNGFEDALLLPVGLTPYLQTTSGTSYLNQTINALFCAVQICSYYNYTLDYEWLMTPQKTASGSSYSPYDFLAKTANFYVQWVEKRAARIDNEYVKDSKSQEYPDKQAYPTDYTANYAKYPEYDESVHGDDYVYVIFDGAHEGSFEFNPNVTIGNVQYLTDTLTEIGKSAAETYNGGYYAERYPLWTDLASHLVGTEGSAYVYERGTSNKGKTIFGLSEDRKVRLISATVNLENVHPGYQMGFNSDPELLQIGRNTIDVMGDDGKALGYGWRRDNCDPKIYTHAARVGYDADTLIKRMKDNAVARMKPNNYINDNTHGWEKVGIVEALNTMMVMSDGGIIKAFPNWNDTDAEFHDVRMPGAFLVSSKMKGGKAQYVNVTSEKGGELNLVIPWDMEAYDTTLINNATGKPVAFTTAVTENSNDTYLTIQTEAGAQYSLLRGYPKTDTPKTPVNLSVAALSADSISLQWEVNPNESEEPTYEVRYFAGDGPVRTLETKDTAAVLSGLEPNASYSISVYARYSENQYSTEGAALTVVTPPASAQHPVILRADNPNAVRNQKIGVTKEELSAALPGNVSAWVYDDANGMRTVDVPVNWDVSGIDTDTTAVQDVPGTILLENGMTNPHNLSVTLSVRLHNNSISFTKESMSYNQKLDLTELGAADWVQIAAADANSISIERKNTSAPKISDIGFTSDATGAYGPIAGASDWAILTKWSDGTTTEVSDPAPATNNIGAGKTAGLRYVGNCYEFTVEGQPYEQELILSLGAWQSLSRLTVSFEDGSEVFVTDTVDSKVDKIGGGLATAHYNNKGAKLFTIKFKATEPGERITVRYGAEKSYATNEQATFQAAMLRRTPGSDIKSELRTLYEANKDKAQGNYTDATWTEFQNALEAAKTVLDNESATEAQVNEALEALQAAVGALSENTAKDIADGITEITAPAKGAEKLILPTVPEGFTVSIKSSSNEAVIDLEGNITPPALDTEVKLVLSVSKGDDTAETRELTVPVPGVGIWKILLKQTIDAAELEAENLPEHIIPAVKEKFLAALENAKTLYAKADATDEELKNADDLLITMMHYLSFTANPEDLQKAVDEADGIIASGKYVADKAFEDYKALRDEAKALLLDEAATDTEYGDMIAKLAEAKAKLTLKPVETLDLSVLEHQINLSQDAYNNLSKYFDGEAKEAFKAAYEKAVQVLEDARKPGTAVTQAEVNKAAQDLHNARPGLRLIPNKAELENLLNRANAKDLSKYTKESGAVLLTAIDMAQAVYDNPLATVEQVKVAEAVLNAAMDNLVPIKNGGAEEPGNKPGDGNDTPTGDSTPIGLVSFGILALGACLVLRKKK